MKKAFLFYIILGLSIGYSQNKQLLYNWEATPQTLMLNPGSLVSHKYHYGVPLLSQVHLNAGASGVSAFDIFAADGIDINTKIEQQIFELSDRDFFTATQQLELLSLGWRTKNDSYLSVGIYQELDFIAYFPKDFAILAWEGNRDYIGYPFNFDDISFRSDLLTVYHAGINKQVMEKLTVGVRLKLYSSILNVTSTNNSGTFTTTQTEGTPNIYEHTVSDLNVAINTSGYAQLRDADGVGGVGKRVLGGAFFGGNVGVGVDLGATYEFNQQLTATVSALDLGAVFHAKNTETYRASGDYTLDGIELLFPEVENGEATFPYYDDLEDEVAREIPFDTLYGAYTQWRPAKINAGLHYDFGQRVGSKNECDCLSSGKRSLAQSQVGAQYYAIFRPKGLQMAGTIYYRRYFRNWLSAKTTYTVDSYSATNIGLGISANMGNVNFFIAADNLLYYTNLAKAKGVSLQLGFTILADEK
ncbi:DUF5723 family protein [Patiriisocius sp. Uisw_017]|uniref:DUF5723 family protein n=1 Tax=Patiriisocius sp. Uisw_017 TaxID=3230968 RepID=UPI0039EAE15C